MQFREEDEKTRAARYKLNPKHKKASLWFEIGPRARYALLIILFEVGDEIQIQIPYAKACILAILQKFYSAAKENGDLPETLWGRVRRGQVGEAYRELHHYACALAETTVTHYMTDIQHAIRDALHLQKGDYCDFLFERGKPWGIRIRPPGITVKNGCGEA